MPTTRPGSPSRLQVRVGLPPTPQVDRLPWAGGVAVESFGVSVGLRTSARGALRAAADRLPPGRPLSTGRVDVLYSLLVGAPGPRPGMRRSHRLYCGDLPVACSLDLQAVLDSLESHSRLLVAACSRRGVFLHAGAVAWRGRAIVLSGASRSGKTTLVAELVKAGATYLSDDFAVIRGDRVVPYPKLPSRDSSAQDPQRPGDLLAPGGRPPQKPIPVGLVVLARFARGAKGRVRRLSRGRAVLSLLSHAPAARLSPQQVLAALECLVRAAPVVCVVRGDARKAARRVLGWLAETA